MRVHILVTDWNHLTDAYIITDERRMEKEYKWLFLQSHTQTLNLQQIRDILVDHLLIGGDFFCIKQLVARGFLSR